MGTKEQLKKSEDDSCTARPAEESGQIPVVRRGLQEKGKLERVGQNLQNEGEKPRLWSLQAVQEKINGNNKVFLKK